MQVLIDGIEYVPAENTPLLTLADVMEVYEGTKEYTGVVAAAQKWYYGYVSETSWCATFLCWCLAQMGIRAYTLDGRAENVYILNELLIQAAAKDKVKQIDPKQGERGDIIIYGWSEPFSTTSSKHVGVISGPREGSLYPTIGGNQDNMIKVTKYHIQYVKGIYRPDYSVSSLKSLSSLPKFEG